MMGNEIDDSVLRAAEARILKTRDTLLSEQKHVREEQRRLAEVERGLERKLADCLAAARFFGIEVSLPVDDEAIAELQRRVRMFEMRLRASETEEERARIFESLSGYRTRLSDLMARKEAEAVAGAPVQNSMQLTVTPETSASASIKSPKVRDVTLDRLQAAGDRGQRASDIRGFIEQSYPVKLHDKTVGMTLYRLSQENLVHRKGQVWFYGPQAKGLQLGGTENPGVASPGPTRD
jgi:hypothetical protein